MNFILAVFKSRSETIYFANMLRNFGIMAQVVNTPRQAGQACGICVKFRPDDFSKVRELLSKKRFQGFAGFYSVSMRNGLMGDFVRM